MPERYIIIGDNKSLIASAEEKLVDKSILSVSALHLGEQSLKQYPSSGAEIAKDDDEAEPNIDTIEMKVENLNLGRVIAVSDESSPPRIIPVTRVYGGCITKGQQPRLGILEIPHDANCQSTLKLLDISEYPYRQTD